VVVAVIEHWYFLDINPEPWAIGPVGYARRNGKMSAYVGRNEQLHYFQEAVREAITKQDPVKFEGPVELTIWFWRSRDDYKTHQARTHRKHEADVTNLYKATEDALQGILYDNDKDNLHTEGYMMGQGPNEHGKIVLRIRPRPLLALPPDTPLRILDWIKGADAQDEIDFNDDRMEWRGPTDESYKGNAF
jgi:Holliday junction resolvase RusA-like endonuclease